MKRAKEYASLVINPHLNIICGPGRPTRIWTGTVGWCPAVTGCYLSLHWNTCARAYVMGVSSLSSDRSSPGVGSLQHFIPLVQAHTPPSAEGTMTQTAHRWCSDCPQVSDECLGLLCTFWLSGTMSFILAGAGLVIMWGDAKGPGDHQEAEQ